MYLPLDDNYSSGTNLGTGGSFTSTGSFEDTGPHYTESDSEGGMVWTKSRSNAIGSALVDTENGAETYLRSDSTAALRTDSRAEEGVTAFNSNGYSLGDWTDEDRFNRTNYTYASWTFRKAEKFFDVVTYTGDGVAGREIAHNLNSDVGFLIIKRTHSAESCLLYTSPSPRDGLLSRMPSSA